MLGYMASFERFHPTDLLEYCKQAEKAGFEGVSASDHFHPWTPQQGQSAFVWAWLGALGATTNLRFGTGVTPPGYRYHPAILAQAAATLEAMFPGRFVLGLERVRRSTSISSAATGRKPPSAARCSSKRSK